MGESYSGPEGRPSRTFAEKKDTCELESAASGDVQAVSPESLGKEGEDAHSSSTPDGEETGTVRGGKSAGGGGTDHCLC